MHSRALQLAHLPIVPGAVGLAGIYLHRRLLVDQACRFHVLGLPPVDGTAAAVYTVHIVLASHVHAHGRLRPPIAAYWHNPPLNSCPRLTRRPICTIGHAFASRTRLWRSSPELCCHTDVVVRHPHRQRPLDNRSRAHSAVSRSLLRANDSVTRRTLIIATMCSASFLSGGSGPRRAVLLGGHEA